MQTWQNTHTRVQCFTVFTMAHTSKIFTVQNANFLTSDCKTLSVDIHCATEATSVYYASLHNIIK